MTEAVYKGRICFDVFGSAASADEFRRMLEATALADILHRADEDDLICGSHLVASVEHVHRDDIDAQLKAIGNDGSFFEWLLEDDAASPRSSRKDPEAN